jgi:hypothetical protein
VRRRVALVLVQSVFGGERAVIFARGQRMACLSVEGGLSGGRATPVLTEGLRGGERTVAARAVDRSFAGRQVELVL